MGEYSAYSSLQADSKVKFAAWPTSWRPPGADPTLAQRNHSELSHMADPVDDSTINIVVVIIIIIISHRHAYGGKAGSGDLQLHTPCYLALCSDNHVLVADNDNGRIVLLNSALEFVRYILDFTEPHRLYFDSSAAGRLYVGECTNGNIKIFQVVYHLK